jgi:predicted nucleotide-binding protein
MILPMAKRPPPHESPEAPPELIPEEGINRLQDLVERANRMLQRPPSPEEMAAYRAALDGALVDAFGSASEWRNRANNAGMDVSPGRRGDPVMDRLKELRAKNLMLGECIDQLKRRAARKTVPRIQLPDASSTLVNMTENHMRRTEGTVFIGHGGRSQAWRDLKDLLQERLGLKPDEFNMEPAAGMTTKERLEEMLNSAVFAFLIMTAEDEHSDKTTHARENVIHEVGLFQGRLGFRRAIVLLEEGCSEFSNIQGLTQIRFPKGNIKAVSEDLRRVLEREGLLPAK